MQSVCYILIKCMIAIHHLINNYCSHKLHFLHNTAAYNPEFEIDEIEDMWDIEMSLDNEIFDADPSEIEVGDFVSFRYAGNFASKVPINPKISFFF